MYIYIYIFPYNVQWVVKIALCVNNQPSALQQCGLICKSQKDTKTPPEYCRGFRSSDLAGYWLNRDTVMAGWDQNSNLAIFNMSFFRVKILENSFTFSHARDRPQPRRQPQQRPRQRPWPRLWARPSPRSIMPIITIGFGFGFSQFLIR